MGRLLDLLEGSPRMVRAHHPFQRHGMQNTHGMWNPRPPCVGVHLPAQTHLKRSSTAWGKVWKLLFRLISVVSFRAIFPKT